MQNMTADLPVPAKTTKFEANSKLMNAYVSIPKSKKSVAFDGVFTGNMSDISEDFPMFVSRRVVKNFNEISEGMNAQEAQQLAKDLQSIKDLETKLYRQFDEMMLRGDFEGMGKLGKEYAGSAVVIAKRNPRTVLETRVRLDSAAVNEALKILRKEALTQKQKIDAIVFLVKKGNEIEQLTDDNQEAACVYAYILKEIRKEFNVERIGPRHNALGY